MRRYPRIVYAIRHTVTGRIYIGSTGKELHERYSAHISLLRKGSHSSKLMQKDFDEFGENYTVYKLDTIPTYNERDMEYQYMLKYDTGNPNKGYNQYDIRLRAKLNSVKMNFSENNDELLKPIG